MQSKFAFVRATQTLLYIKYDVATMKASDYYLVQLFNTVGQYMLNVSSFHTYFNVVQIYLGLVSLVNNENAA